MIHLSSFVYILIDREWAHLRGQSARHPFDRSAIELSGDSSEQLFRRNIGYVCGSDSIDPRILY
jgi:hypothetical protein